jgi:hypothetical protein
MSAYCDSFFSNLIKHITFLHFSGKPISDSDLLEAPASFLDRFALEIWCQVFEFLLKIIFPGPAMIFISNANPKTFKMPRTSNIDPGDHFKAPGASGVVLGTISAHNAVTYSRVLIEDRSCFGEGPFFDLVFCVFR